MKIWFAACARNCVDMLSQNVAVLLNAAEVAQAKDVKVYILENDSVDGTRDAIISLSAHDNRIVPVLLESLDGQFSTREARIAFCRDHLLGLLGAEHSDGLYCPVDIDLNLSFPGFAESFFASCKLVESGICNGVFPSSAPFYYDIHALRAHDWCLGSCWKEVQDSRARGALWRLLVVIRYISSRQKHYLKLKSNELGLIPVYSAFGGLGVYSLRMVVGSGACYSSPALSQQDLKLCEHVIFNSCFDRLFINTGWLIAAPVDHIGFRLLSAPRQLLALFQAALSDAKQVAKTALK